MKRKIYFFTLFVIFLTLGAGPGLAQNNNYIGSTVVNPPTTSSLGKYGAIPIGYNTGVPNISIPIFEIKERDLTVPFTLRYHSSGIKVQETASWVGLGWSLDGAGAIVRTIRNAPDEGSSGTGWKSGGVNNLLPYDASNSNTDAYNRAAGGSLDTEPDIFTISFPGLAGTFVFGEDGNIQMIEESDLLITASMSSNQLLSFTVTNEVGDKYIFSAREYTQLSQFSADNPGIAHPSAQPYVTAWYISRIEAADGKAAINYTYDDEHYGYENLGSAMRIQSEMQSNYPCFTAWKHDGSQTIISDDDVAGKVVADVQGKRLREISWSSGKMIFTANHARQDLTVIGTVAPRALDEITISTASGVCLKKYKFEKDYFQGTSAGYIASNPTGVDIKRLRLRKLIEANCSGTSSGGDYVFQYYDKDFNDPNNAQSPPLSAVLPRRLSHSQDHWGYHNGQFTNKSLFTAIICSGDANREPSFPAMQVGILNKITFPTGGSTLFEYEPHYYNEAGTAKIAGGLRVKKTTDAPGAGMPNVTTAYEYLTTSGLSSGKLLKRVNYVYENYENFFTQGNQASFSCYTYPKTRIYRFFTANSLSLVSHQGSTVTYGRIKVKNADASYSVFTYGSNGTTNPHSIQSNTFPQPPAEQLTLFAGRMTQEAHYDNKGGAVKTVDYVYTGQNLGSIRAQSVVAYPRRVDLCGTVGPIDAMENGGETDYLIHYGRISLTKRTETVDGVTTSYDYKYRSDWAHHNPISVGFTNSDGGAISESTLYAADLAGTETWASGLLQKHMIGVLLQSRRIERPSGQTSSRSRGTRTVYATSFSGVTTHPYPKSFQELQTDGVWSNKYTINKYNTTNGLASEGIRQGYTVPEKFTYSGNLLTFKEFGDLKWSYTYKPGTNLIETITDENGQKTMYTYDPFLRLKEIKSKFNPTDNTYKVTTQLTYAFRSTTVANNSITTQTTYADNTAPDKQLQYFDLLGRPLQTVRANYAPDATKSIAQGSVTYNALGLPEKTYLPYQIGSATYTAPSTSAKFTRTVYEASPLHRPLQEVFADGNSVSYAYSYNTTEDQVIKFSGQYASGFYGPNLFFKKVITNENGHKRTEFTDKAGRIILIREHDGVNPIETYHRYNGYGELEVVCPPGIQVSDYGGYYYYYDRKHRLSYKKVPGAGETRYYYDNRDLLTLMQDANMKAESAGKHQFTKYDDRGRIVKKGMTNSTAPVVSSTGDANTTFTELEVHNTYTYEAGKNRPSKSQAKLFGVTSITYVSRNHYYDEYNRTKTISFNGFDGSSQYQGYSYDLADHVVFETLTHYGQTYTNTEKDYTYDNGNRLSKVTFGINGSFTVADEIIAQYKYNEWDENIEKNIGSSAAGTPNFLQSVDYGYNDRGWLTRINRPLVSTNNWRMPTCSAATLAPTATAQIATADGDAKADLFGMELNYYNSITAVNAAGQKNGNIASMTWQVYGRERQAYGFRYDNINRMLGARYEDLQDNGTYTTQGKFDEQLTYTKNGNVATLKRRGAKSGCIVNNLPAYTYDLIDDLTYVTDGITNRLQKVTDNSGVLNEGFTSLSNGSSYTYDANGNLTSDPNKGITSITYFVSNLPKKVTLPAGKTIEFIYDADGVKHAKIVKNSSGAVVSQQNYYGDKEYTGNVLEAFYHAEGRVVKKGTVWRHEYYLKDHLGNSRVGFCDLDGNRVINPATEIVQINHYYPFGLDMKGNWNGPGGNNKYRYNGKELNTELNWYDYGARWYDPAMVRWTSVDPLATEFAAHSPYQYAYNNPLRFVDPDGRSADDIILRGANNSSITIQTNILNVDLDASALIGDIGGNYVLGGTDAVITGLDIVGVVDPTPLSDGISAGLSAQRGDYWGAGASVLGAAFPVLGDIAKTSKIAKGLEKISEAISNIKSGGKTFDQARREAFSGAGMNDPSTVTFSKYDPNTGTVVEFKGPGGAKVGYDGPHPNTPGKHHDVQHISYQSAGRRGSGGAVRDNIPYDGPQHPSRSQIKYD